MKVMGHDGAAYPILKRRDYVERSCFGRFGYMTGFRLKELKKYRKDAFGFCNFCEQGKDCWAEHRKRVKEANSEAYQEYRRAVDVLVGEGMEELAAEQSVCRKLHEAKEVDPYVAEMIRNIEAGAKDRETN
ncbi:MAG: hypothetical protein ACYC1U_06795 [Candidatus Aquicultorales bacterium]